METCALKTFRYLVKFEAILRKFLLTKDYSADLNSHRKKNPFVKFKANQHLAHVSVADRCWVGWLVCVSRGMKTLRSFCGLSAVRLKKHTAIDVCALMLFQDHWILGSFFSFLILARKNKTKIWLKATNGRKPKWLIKNINKILRFIKDFVRCCLSLKLKYLRFF